MRALWVEPILIVLLHMDASCGRPRALLTQGFHRVEWLSMPLGLGWHGDFIGFNSSNGNVASVLGYVIVTPELFELILFMDYL